MSDVFDIFKDMSDESVLDAIAKVLRKTLGVPVEYGYDAMEERYFFNIPGYTYINFKSKFLKDRRWDIIIRVVELLEEDFYKKKESGLENG